MKGFEVRVRDVADGRDEGPELLFVVQQVGHGVQVEVHSPSEDGEDVSLGGAYVDYFDNKLRVIIDHPNSEVKIAEVLQKDVAAACQKPQG